MRVDRKRHPEHTALAHDVKPASLTHAYLASRSALSRYIATFFVEREEIEDTLQQAYLEALVAASKTEIRSPRAFLFRVARNIALNRKTRQNNCGATKLASRGHLPAAACTPKLAHS